MYLQMVHATVLNMVEILNRYAIVHNVDLSQINWAGDWEHQLDTLFEDQGVARNAVIDIAGTKWGEFLPVGSEQWISQVRKYTDEMAYYFRAMYYTGFEVPCDCQCILCRSPVVIRGNGDDAEGRHYCFKCDRYIPVHLAPHPNHTTEAMFERFKMIMMNDAIHTNGVVLLRP
jgi:hypothetical protein